MSVVKYAESTRARALGWAAAVLGVSAFAMLILTAGSEISHSRYAERLSFSYHFFYLPGLCAGAAGLATGLIARPLGKREGEARREAVIGIVLSVIALAGLAAVRVWGAWLVGAA